MKITRCLFVTSLIITAPKISQAAADDVSAIIVDMPVTSVLSLYEIWAGHPVVMSSEIKAIKTPVSVTIRKKTKEEALRIFEDVLAKQAGVEIVHEPDGSFSARKIDLKK